MKIEKLQVEKSKFDINLKFYFLLKYIVKAKLSEKQVLDFLKIFTLFNEVNFEITVNKFYEHASQVKWKPKKDTLYIIIETLENEIDIWLFIFSLKLYLIKDLLLQEAKLTDVIGFSDLEKLDPLSLEYDKISVYKPYSTRVNWALLALLFFEHLEEGNNNFISKGAVDFINGLSKSSIALKKSGLEPNQIFMLMFSESINQSIISDSGSDYEDRIFSVLVKMGIKEQDIKKVHDKNDASTEFDFFFELKGKTYGIWAKRTLRERYKGTRKNKLPIL